MTSTYDRSLAIISHIFLHSAAAVFGFLPAAAVDCKHTSAFSPVKPPYWSLPSTGVPTLFGKAFGLRRQRRRFGWRFDEGGCEGRLTPSSQSGPPRRVDSAAAALQRTPRR
jgi:hypothetical protein